MIRAPNGRNASSTAAAIAASGAAVPASPTPLTPSGLSGLGVKGVGEGGALAPPAAIAAAVEDALSRFGARITSTPIRAEALLRLIRGLDGGNRRP